MKYCYYMEARSISETKAIVVCYRKRCPYQISDALFTCCCFGFWIVCAYALHGRNFHVYIGLLYIGLPQCLAIKEEKLMLRTTTHFDVSPVF